MKHIRELSWLDLDGIQNLPIMELIAEIKWIDNNISNPEYTKNQYDRLSKYRRSLENEYRYRKNNDLWMSSPREINKIRNSDDNYKKYYSDPNTLILDRKRKISSKPKRKCKK